MAIISMIKQELIIIVKILDWCSQVMAHKVHFKIIII